jgi:DNA-binding beta-propeller fold protein YncE
MHTHRVPSHRWASGRVIPAVLFFFALFASIGVIAHAASDTPDKSAKVDKADKPDKTDKIDKADKSDKLDKADSSAATQPGQWLVTTHSGDDVILFSDTGKLLRELVLAKAGGLAGSRGLLFMPGGDLLVACSQKAKSAILRFHPDGTLVGLFASGGTLSHPYAMAFGPDHNLYVSGQDDDAVSRFNGVTGAFINTFVPAGAGGMKTIRDIIFDPDGELLVASRDTNSILKYDGASGKPLGEMVHAGDGGLSKPIQLLFGPDHDLYVGSSGNSSVIRFNGKTGTLIDVFVKPKDHGLDAPSGMAFDPATGDLLVESRLGSQILRYSASGVFKDVFVDKANLDTPEYILPLPTP